MVAQDPIDLPLDSEPHPAPPRLEGLPGGGGRRCGRGGDGLRRKADGKEGSQECEEGEGEEEAGGGLA